MHMQGFLSHRDCSLKMKIGHYIVHLSLAQPRPMGILQNPNKCKAQVQRHLVKVAANCLNFLGCGVTAAMCFSACHISILSCSDLSLELCPFTWVLLTLWPIPSSDKQHISAPIYSWLRSGFNTSSHYSTILLIIVIPWEQLSSTLKSSHYFVTAKITAGESSHPISKQGNFWRTL